METEKEKLEKASQESIEGSCQIAPPSERFKCANPSANLAIFVANRSRQVPMGAPRPEEAKFSVNDHTSPPLFEMLEANISREKVIGELASAMSLSPEEKAVLTRKFSAALGIPTKHEPKVSSSPSQTSRSFLESQESLMDSSIQSLVLEREKLLRQVNRLTERIEFLKSQI